MQQDLLYGYDRMSSAERHYRSLLDRAKRLRVRVSGQESNAPALLPCDDSTTVAWALPALQAAWVG